MIVGVFLVCLLIIICCFAVIPASVRTTRMHGRFYLAKAFVTTKASQPQSPETENHLAFFAGLEGAMTLLKSEAWITARTLILLAVAGYYVGILMRGMPWDESLWRLIPLVTGLGISQLGAITLTAIAVSWLMNHLTFNTEAAPLEEEQDVCRSSFMSDVVACLRQNPYALLFSSVYLLLCASTTGITGIPWWPNLILAIVMIGFAFSVFHSVYMVNAQKRAKTFPLDECLPKPPEETTECPEESK